MSELLLPPSQNARSGIKWMIVCGLATVAVFYFVISFAGQLGLEKTLDSIVLMQVSEIAIEAESPLTKEDVRDWLPQLSGKNILLVNAVSLVERLKKHPWVEDVSIKKFFPNRVNIGVTAKKPFVLAITQGQPYFMDRSGNWIEKVRPRFLKGLDLPVIQCERENEWVDWRLGDVLKIVAHFQESQRSSIQVSQVVLGNFPFLKVFFQSPRLELSLNMDTWTDQVSQLPTLLQNPGWISFPIRRIDLSLQKKAVVSSSLSN